MDYDDGGRSTFENRGKKRCRLLYLADVQTPEMVYDSVVQMYPLDGKIILAIASKGGAEKHPEWYFNILVHPDVTVEVGNEPFAARARVLTSAGREKAFARTVEVFPPYGEYQKKAPREIPVIALDRPDNEEEQTASQK